MSARANIVTKYEVEYGNDFNTQMFLDAIESYRDYKDYEDCLIFCQPEDCEYGLYEFHRSEFNNFVEWAKENVASASLFSFIEELGNSNPNDPDYVRVEIW